MLIKSKFILCAILAAIACVVHGAEFPTALEGEGVRERDGWRNTMKIRELSFTEGQLTGRGDLSVKPPKLGQNRCMRMDMAINGTYSLATDGSIRSLVLVFPSPAGIQCNTITARLVFDSHSGDYLGTIKSFKWILRAVK